MSHHIHSTTWVFASLSCLLSQGSNGDDRFRGTNSGPCLFFVLETSLLPQPPHTPEGYSSLSGLPILNNLLPQTVSSQQGAAGCHPNSVSSHSPPPPNLLLDLSQFLLHPAFSSKGTAVSCKPQGAMLW